MSGIEIILALAILAVLGVALYLRKKGETPAQALQQVEGSISSSHVVQIIQAHTQGIVAAIQATKPVVAPLAAVGYVAPPQAQTIVYDPASGPFDQLYSKYPVGTNFVSPRGGQLDNRGNEVTAGFTQGNQGG